MQLIHSFSSPFQIVILMFGCAELLMGFQFSGEEFKISAQLYIPFWQGALVLTVAFYWLALTC